MEDIFTLTVPTAMRLPLPPPRREPLEGPELRLPEFIFVHLLFYDTRNPMVRVSAPAVVYALYPPRLAARLLRAAVAAAEVYMLLNPWGFTPWGKPTLPKEWKVGAVVFGHNDVVACSILYPDGPSFLTLGAVRVEKGWLAAKADLSEWEKAWAIGEPPASAIPFSLPPEPLDSAVAAALRAAEHPHPLWLSEYEREVGGMVENTEVEVEGRRLAIPRLYLP
ncbi:MAG: hypothetical protein QXU62_08680 [Thermofilaceae archaeon]